MYHLLRPLLFKLDPERAHDWVLKTLDWLPASLFTRPSGKPVEALGLRFPHPVGLAAGLDKNGAHLDGLAKLGFSFIELGTVTPKPQPGNPKPRLFRLPEAQAIINRMGFNNHGVDVLVANVSRAAYRGILGINIGKNKDTPLDHAVEDYRYCLQKVYAHASYVTINISSPNTPDLRRLQEGDFLAALLTGLTEEQQRLADQYQRLVPLVVKVSPDESDETLKRMADVIVAKGIAGIIATNTTCARDAVAQLPYGGEIGGLSGRPLVQRSTACLKLLKQVAGDAVTLIGAGGIDNGETAREKLEGGAALVQVYTGLIYQGPSLVGRLVQELSKNRR
ncbi:quinone-dependent dihydroorotate dehydrogenase [Legionella spiritensis]|uniref:quinone-dependent dihydroorotate dehydrogenase n=1 Tax=Legionella spiritensis TaxID=452 RepID=UPI000F6BCD4D|nr:quinone-dependent dihydroorotate dehydrogenase [Legionella spiritensis]VEG92393.1 dihydroorotate oxidase [Legionella spiritensis]